MAQHPAALGVKINEFAECEPFEKLPRVCEDSESQREHYHYHNFFKGNAGGSPPPAASSIELRGAARPRCAQIFPFVCSLAGGRIKFDSDIAKYGVTITLRKMIAECFLLQKHLRERRLQKDLGFNSR